MKFSLIVVERDSGGAVTGQWVQDHVGTLESATARAKEIEAVSGGRISIAVVDELPSPVPGLSLWKDRKRLDVPR